MNIENPFDRAIQARFNAAQRQAADPLISAATGGKSAEQVRDCAVYVTDTVDLFWAAARSVFGTKAKPEHALAMFDTFSQLLKESKAESPAQQTRPIFKTTEEMMRYHASPPPAAPTGI